MEPPASPGSPLRISAADYNAAVEAGRRWRDQGRLGRGPYSSTPQIVPAIVKVRNSTSGSLAAGSVVELNATPMGELSRRNLVFDGVARTGVDPFCAVLINPLDQLEIGPAVIAGAVMAPVNIVDADNTHARVESGATQLKGDFGGWCRILYKPSGTGVKTCVVAVGHTEQTVRKARATTTITDGGTGSADIYIGGSQRGNVTVHFNWFTGSGNIVNGSDLMVQYYHDEDKWIVVGAECPP
jgi:hypothetical protein